MSAPLRAALFDLDGTLIDTAPDFAFVLNTMRSARGLPELPYEVIRRTVSNGARAVVVLGFGADHPELEALREEFLSLYDQNLANTSRLFEGLDPLLLTLEARGIPWGIVTNKPSRYTDPLLAALGLSRRCAVAICPDHVSKTKPDPEPMFQACDALGIQPGPDVVYVGDHRRDIEAGRHAGMTTVAALWGYIDHDEQPEDWQADHMASSTEDLAHYLLADD